MTAPAAGTASNPELSLSRLLDPAVLANPYPLYARLRREAPVHWDPFLHVWVVTRYADVLTVLHDFSARRSQPSENELHHLGLSELNPIAQMMARQMLFLDPPAHGRLRGLAAKAFTPRRVELLRDHIAAIVHRLIDQVAAAGRMDVIADFAAPLPAIVTAEMLGVPASDWSRLKGWSADYAEMLGNFQQNPDGVSRVLESVEAMTTYFRSAIREQEQQPRGLIGALLAAEEVGDRLTEDEIIANVIITMVGGQETTTNLIGNGLLTLLRHPDVLDRLRADPSLIPSAVEELLRFESPSQHTARIAPADVTMGDRTIARGQGVVAVMAAGNRDPERFPDPDALDVSRADNRHLAFGWAAHFCFGAPLARLEGQIAFSTLLSRLANLRLGADRLAWRQNLGLRGLEALPVTFTPSTPVTA